MSPVILPEASFFEKVLTNEYHMLILFISNIYSRTGGVHLNLIISNASGKPIYEQIYTQVKNCIISGELSPGDALPSIRALAKDLRISVITTTRAYDELERDGFIDRVPGKGCYVAEKNLELVREAHMKQIEEHMTEIVTLAAGCSLSEEDTVRMLRLIWENEGKDDTF